jgi:3-deoxy-7-phosphoheptulonate synthase
MKIKREAARKKELFDKNIAGYETLISPQELKERFPLSCAAVSTVRTGREDIEAVLDRRDSRKIIITGPCSIHDINSAIDYAERIKNLSEKVRDKFILVMRTYFEKPRTAIGWKGLIPDPGMDGSGNIQEGLEIARELLCDIASLGVTSATEFLNTSTPQYIDDLISWAAVGARTTESQPHREMASGLSMPVGFKNNLFGEIDVAVNAIIAASGRQCFLGVGADGRQCKVTTFGNDYCHIVLRGGNGEPNYNNHLVNTTLLRMKEAGIKENVIVDCSHGNSNKNYYLQPMVFVDVMDQITKGQEGIMGVMLESNIYEGNQPIKNDGSRMRYGVSVTDGCIVWEVTERLILDAYDRLSVGKDCGREHNGLRDRF